MGRTYHSIKNENLTFDVNFCGADVLGYAVAAVGEQYHDKHLEEYEKKIGQKLDRAPSTKYKTTKKECLQMASKLEDFFVNNTNQKEIISVYNECKHCIDGDMSDFIWFVKEWIEFLRTCEGYKVI